MKFSGTQPKNDVTYFSYAATFCSISHSVQVNNKSKEEKEKSNASKKSRDVQAKVP